MITDPVSNWLAALGTLTAAAMTPDEAQVRIDAYAPLLRDKFAPGAFTRDSLEAVAAASKFFPTYGEVCERLSKFWREHRPKPPQPLAREAIAAPPQQAPGDFDLAAALAQIGMLEGQPADGLRTIHARTLLTMLDRHRPDLVAVHGDRLRALMTPAKPFRSAYLRPSHVTSQPNLATSQPIREVPLRPEAMLAQLEREIAAGRATDATRTRAAALRRQIATAALHPQPRAAE